MSQTVIEFGDAQAVFNSVCKQMNRLNWSAVKAKRLQKEKEDEKEKEKEREKEKEQVDKRKTLVGDCVLGQAHSAPNFGLDAGIRCR